MPAYHAHHECRSFFAVSLLLASAFSARALAAQSASISAPAEVKVGAEIEVTWTGPGGPQDFISLDPDGAPEARYGPYKYAKSGNPVTLRAPGEPGRWLVRYHSGESGYPVLSAAPVSVVADSATVQAPAAAEIGAEISVAWTGPDNPGDFISVDPAGAPESDYGHYAYTAKGSPLTLPVPVEPGPYLVRYHLGVGGYAVIGSAPLAVGGTTATVEAPAQVDAGGTLSVRWSGPGNKADFVSVDPAGAPESEYGHYAYVTKGNPLELPVPDEPGTYEVRYHLGTGGYRVLGSATMEVGGVEASVAAAEPVAGEPFEVTWSGPDNERDFITIVPSGAPEREYENYAYTRRGNPLRLEAPKTPGSYEVRYLTGQAYKTLAAAAVEVRPSQARGRLKVVAAEGAPAEGAGAVEVILDASGSMLQRLGGERRIELARAALLDLTGDALPEAVPFALRIFGHREADSCRTDLEIPLGPLDRGGAAAAIRSVEAKNLAKTPIADSLRHVEQDLAKATGPRLVVLVTDGEETCGGDPQAVIRGLASAGVDVRVNVVGFAIDELMLKEEFETWARLGGGRYFDASDGEALRQAVRGALRPTFDVLSGAEVVATGTVGGDAVELKPGEYRVRAAGRVLGPVAVAANEETLVSSGG